MTRIREVRTRDRRLVPFDRRRIALAISKAYRAIGEDEPALAEELAEAVEHFLEEKLGTQSSAAEASDASAGRSSREVGELETAAESPARDVLDIEEIQDVVETVLMEMGDRRVAKAYILYRARRAALRESLEVRREEPSDEGAPIVARDGDRRGGSSPWSRSRIVAALIREADLEPAVASEVAARVEGKVLESGIRRISTSLVRELVDNELFERGFEVKLRRQAPIAIAKFNLEQILFGSDSKEGFAYAKGPAEVRNLIADRILRRYALEEIHSAEVADAHREGRIFVHDLADPVRVERVRWDLPVPILAGLNAPGAGGATRLRSPEFTFIDRLNAARRRRADSERTSPRSPGPAEPGVAAVDRAAEWLDFGDFLRRLRALTEFVSREVSLRGLPRLLSDPGLAEPGEGRAAREALSRLLDAAGSTHLVLELDVDDSVTPWLDAIAGLDADARARVAVLLRAGTARLRSSWSVRIAELAALGVDLRVDSMAGAPRDARAPGAARLGDSSAQAGAIRVDAGRVTVSLPRAALYVSAVRPGRRAIAPIEASLDDAISLADRALLERRHAVERLSASPAAPLWALFGAGGGLGLSDRLRLREVGEFAIGLSGLNECVQILTGEDLSAGAARHGLGREILSHLARRVESEARALGLALRLEETRDAIVAEELAALDRRIWYGHSGAIRVASRPAGTFDSQSPQGAVGENGLHTPGVRWPRTAPIDPLERLQRTVELVHGIQPRGLRPAGGLFEDVESIACEDQELFISFLESAWSLLQVEDSTVDAKPPAEEDTSRRPA